MRKVYLSCLLAIVSLGAVIAQSQISGTITDDDNQPLPGASVIEIGTTNGTITDFEGKYTLTASSSATLRISFVGYETMEINVGGKSIIDVTLLSEELEEVIIVGTRAMPRSSTDTPLPVDILSSRDIVSTGQNSFDKALQYKIPSFNTVQTPVNDATSLLDPYEIRNMGPSRTLILINGKRKNLSALLNLTTSPARGETGADISAIPVDAIKRVEVLRDGASAQYGSDAIAGVMNIILKDDADYGSVTLRTGITAAGDGGMLGISVNNGTPIGKGKGFINYTVDFSKVGQANRPGEVSAEGEASDFGADLAVVQDFLERHPDAGNINGSPATTAAKFLVNGGVELGSDARLYFNAAYVYKNVNSFANYRTPYWMTLDDHPYLSDFFPDPNGVGGYDGYLPTFDGIMGDYNGTVGFAAKRNGWNYDLSVTVGGNKQNYRVRNSHNRFKVLSPAVWVDKDENGEVDPGEMTESFGLYREKSPTSFDPGGVAFDHIVGNIDINKPLSDRLSIGFGAEFRSEVFTITEGQLNSYDGGGSDSFAGSSKENSGRFNRYNFGGYFDIAWDIFDNLLLNGTARIEDYSDFGNAFVWKVSSRYKFLDDKITVRASVSTGFRAPTLHQIYTQQARYAFVPGEGVQLAGTINNVSPQARLLGVPKLSAENSTNISAGIGAKLNRKFNFTVDYYNIKLEDRVLFSTQIGNTDAGTTELDAFLKDNGFSNLSFFINGVDTRTSGVDVVASYKNIEVGRGFLGFNLSGNYTIGSEIEGDVKNPKLIADADQSVINATSKALFLTSRPKTKWILGIRYEMGKFDISLNNTFFGKSTFKQSGMDSNLRTEFVPKLVTDLGISFAATDRLTIALNINNLLNVLPEWKFVAENAAGQAIIDDTSITSSGLTPIENNSNSVTFNQRYSQMTYDGSHFSQLGMLLNLAVNYRF